MECSWYWWLGIPDYDKVTAGDGYGVYRLRWSPDHFIFGRVYNGYVITRQGMYSMERERVGANRGTSALSSGMYIHKELRFYSNDSFVLNISFPRNTQVCPQRPRTLIRWSKLFL